MAIMQSDQHLPSLLRVAAAVHARTHLLRYAAFAAAAIWINLLTQNTVLVVVGEFWFGIYAAILFGNASGLVFKFIVDKYWVFEDMDPSLAASSRKFALYAAFGAFTTLLFWAVELTFHYIFQTACMTSVGAVIGLCIGYVIKYNLDKHVTFADHAEAGSR
jgi:putative flippase GtrA